MVLEGGQDQALDREADHQLLLGWSGPSDGGNELGDDLGPPLGHLGGGDAGLAASPGGSFTL